jgi:thiamine-phosphate pyrophosphorylase
MIELIVPPFYPVLDTALLSRMRTAARLTPMDASEAILEGGARILQLRHKAHFSRQAFGEARQIARLCEQAQALLIINDRADIAALLNAGLHLGQNDLPPREARKLLAPEQPLGFSTHNERQLRAAIEEPVDYLALGPIFATRSKENPDPVVGLEELRKLRAITGQPLVAIGGITRESALAVLEAGADSVAVIGDLLPEECTRQTLRERTEEWILLLKK